MTEERAANIAAHAHLTSQYRSLPRETQKRLVADYRREQLAGGTMSWSTYVAVVMPLLPDEARQ
jgi:hypothetical protein